MTAYVLDTIPRTINVLLKGSEEVSDFQYIGAIIRLSSWLRFAPDEADWDAASLGGVASYLLGKYGNVPLSKISEVERDFINNSYSLSTLYYLSNGLLSPNINYENTENINGYHSELNMIAKTIKFLLWYRPEVNDKRQAASLKKAHILLSKTNYFGIAWRDIAWSTFNKRWSRYVDACAFIYVSYFHFRNFLALDPRTADYSEKVNCLLSRREDVVLYLRNVAWVHMRLDGILDRRVPLPDNPFTNSLEPLPLAEVRMRGGASRLIKEEMAKQR